jgi:hypothetical protein
MTTYAVQSPPHAGGLIALAAPSGITGDVAPTGNGVGLLVVCTAAITVTLPIAAEFDSNLPVTSRTVACGIGTSLIPLPSNVYGIGTTPVNYSSVTGVTVAAIRVSN